MFKDLIDRMMGRAMTNIKWLEGRILKPFVGNWATGVNLPVDRLGHHGPRVTYINVSISSLTVIHVRLGLFPCASRRSISCSFRYKGERGDGICGPFGTFDGIIDNYCLVYWEGFN